MLRPRAVLLPLAALAAFAAAPSGASADTVSTRCGTVDVQQVYGFAQDTRWYTPAPDGTFERRAAGWALAGGTAVIAGNNTLALTRAAGSSSLSLPAAGASATSPTVCLGSGMADFRFAVRNTGAATSTLKVEVLTYSGSSRNAKVESTGTVKGGTAWTSPAPFSVAKSLNGNDVTRSVAYRFTVVGAGKWQIDDLFIDPLRRS